MHKSKVVGEAVFPQIGRINHLVQGAGVSGAFDKKGEFREPPAPVCPVVSLIREASRHG